MDEWSNENFLFTIKHNHFAPFLREPKLHSTLWFFDFSTFAILPWANVLLYNNKHVSHTPFSDEGEPTIGLGRVGVLP